MKELIKVTTNENNEQLVSARELHEFLEVSERYSSWFERMLKYGFSEGEDFVGCKVFNTLARRELQDHILKLDMAKEISMIQRSEKGKLARQYFLQVEKAWNSEEMILMRSRQILERKVETLQLENEEMKPKALFADSVSASHTSILVGELAKLIKQNGVDIGSKRLFSWLREKEYLIKRKGTDWNMPTQKAMDLGLFEIKETTISHSDGHISINKTSKVTGKGQVYFVNKFLGGVISEKTNTFRVDRSC